MKPNMVSSSLPVITQSVHQSTANTILDAAVRSQIGVRVGDIYDDRHSSQVIHFNLAI